MSRLRFDSSRPLFVAQEFQGDGKTWTLGEHFPWRLLGYNFQDDTLHTLYNYGFLHHNPEIESEFLDIIESTPGDGLESLTIEALNHLVEMINQKVKARARNPREFQKKRCATSRIKDKQIGKIRSWRSAYGYMEN